jgi:hypothetical protein
MKKSGALHTPLSNLDLFELVTLNGDGLLSGTMESHHTL